MKISEILKDWYARNRRGLPWRNTRDPYLIWVSEIILQQTRVDQGKAYYLRFTEAFPDLASLAAAPIDRVLRLWQGLGYYSRARNMHATARHIRDELGGRFPDNFEDLKKLRGIGDYTAAAIASICFGQPVPVVDGNVTRVLSRLYGIRDPVGSSRSTSAVRKYAGELMDGKDPGGHNQAVMEFGALRCVPVNPRCTDCPLSRSCYAYRHKLTETIPARKKGSGLRRRYFHYLVIVDGERVWLTRRTGGEIWNLLYEFPMIETSEPVDPDELMKGKEWKRITADLGAPVPRVSPEVTHRLTHQLITARFYLIKSSGTPGRASQACFPAGIGRLSEYPFPQLLADYIRNSNFL